MGESIQLTAFGGYDKLKVVKVEYPELKRHCVIISVEACGINFCDILARQGIYTPKDFKIPGILGAEAAGIIKEIGQDVTDFQEGDRVLCWNFTYGMFSRFICVPAAQCRKIPTKMEFVEAAAIPINYITAYFAVIKISNLKPGETILIQCAAGGVGWACTQMAKLIPDVVIFGTSSSPKHADLMQNGVNHPIDYRSADYVQEIRKLAPDGVDVVIDCLSGADFTKGQSLLKDFGRIVHIGISSVVAGEQKSWLNMVKLWWQTKSISIEDVTVSNQSISGLHIANVHERNPNLFGSVIDEILELYNEGKIKPQIDSTWSFREVDGAQRYMMMRRSTGKIILIPDKGADGGAANSPKNMSPKA